MNPSTLNQLSSLVRPFRSGLLCLLALNFQTHAATVTWSPVEITGAALSCRMYFVPTNIALNSGNNLNLGQPKNIAAGTTNTTLLAGDYTVSSPDAPFRRPFLIAVPDDTNTYNITALRNPPVTYTYTNRLVGIASQVRPGTNVTFTTNNAGLVTEYVTISASASGSTYTNTSGTVGVIAGSGIGTNTSHLVGTNAWATTNALKADLASLTIAATNSGAYVSATNGTTYNLTIASGNGRGLTNLQSTNIVGGDLALDGSFFFTNEFIYTPKTLSADGAYSYYAGTYYFAGITWYEGQYGINSNGKILAWDYLNRSGADSRWVLFDSVEGYLSGALPVLMQDSENSIWVTLQSVPAGISPMLSDSAEPEERSFKRAASQSENSLWLQNKDFFVEAKLKSGLGLNLEVNTHEMPSYNPAFAGAYFLLDVRPQFQGLTIYNKEGNAFMHKYSIVDGAYESASGVMWDSLGTITAPATKTVLDATGGASSVKTVEGDVFYPHTVDGNLIWTTSP